MYRYQKICSALLALLVALTPLLGACGRKDEDVPTYRYAVVRSEGTDETFTSSFTDAAELGLYPPVHQATLTDVKGERTSPFTSESAAYQYSNCAERKAGAKVRGDDYSVYDVYDSGQESLVFLHGGDLLCQYLLREDGAAERKTLTVGEAADLAQTFLKTFLTDRQLAKFGEPTVTEGPDGAFQYTVSYARKIAGFQTDETIAVFISSSGKAVGYNGDNLNRYDGYDGAVSADALNQAKQLLEQRIQSLGLTEYTNSAPIVTADVNGGLYLRIDVAYRDVQGMQRAESCLINVIG